MKVKTYSKKEYKGCPIYFRNLKHHFEYLTVIKGEIYTAHIEVKPTLFNCLFYWLGWQELYSFQQQQNILKILNRMAETTIDTILKSKKHVEQNIAPKK
jgi:hypothetical protein